MEDRLLHNRQRRNEAAIWGYIQFITCIQVIKSKKISASAFAIVKIIETYTSCFLVSTLYLGRLHRLVHTCPTKSSDLPNVNDIYYCT